MKPRLIKFTCHSCGARLAVPPEMAGLSDQCPKCGELVTAPVASAVLAAPAMPEASAPAPTPAPPSPSPSPPVASLLPEEFVTAAVPEAYGVPKPKPKLRPMGAEAPAASTAPEKVAAQKMAPEGWSTDALADALTPERKRTAPAQPKRAAPVEQVFPSLLEAPPMALAPPAPLAPPKTLTPLKEAPPPKESAPPKQEPESRAEAPLPPTADPAPETAPVVAKGDAPAARQPAHEILDSILRRKQAAKSTVSPREAPLTAESPAAGGIGEAATPHRTALAPRQVTDPHEVEKAAMPGMGEMLATSGAVPISGLPPESRPLLHVPFLPVKASPSAVRRAKMANLWNTGIVCFVLVDVLVVLLAWVYWDNITDWWNRGNTSAAPPAVAHSTANRMSEPVQHEPPASTPGESASPPSPGPTISSPSDFAPDATVPNPSGKASIPPEVPMAIPLPGHSLENVPTAIAIPSETPAPSTQPTQPTQPPSSPLLPVPPLPDQDATPAPPAVAAAPATDAPAVTSPAVEVVPQMTSPTLSEASIPPPPAIPEALPETPLPEPPPTPAPTTPRKIGKVPAEARSALETLEKFLDAPGWSERSAYVQKSDTVRAAMEKHAAASGDGPIRVGEINFLERYPSKAGVPPYCMFEVSGGALEHPVLTLVEQSPKDGVRVDWEAFVEFKDDMLLHFLEKKGAPPQKFRGLLRRKHYFDKDVPDIAGKDSFELAQPNANFEGHVFVPRNSTLGKQLANQLPWGQDMPVIAELVWKSDSKAWWVQIESIVSYGWRG